MKMAGLSYFPGIIFRIVSPLHTYLGTFKDVSLYSHVQSCKLTHVSGVLCHVPQVPSTSDWVLCTLIYNPVQSTVV